MSGVNYGIAIISGVDGKEGRDSLFGDGLSVAQRSCYPSTQPIIKYQLLDDDLLDIAVLPVRGSRRQSFDLICPPMQFGKCGLPSSRRGCLYLPGGVFVQSSPPSLSPPSPYFPVIEKRFDEDLKCVTIVRKAHASIWSFPSCVELSPVVFPSICKKTL